MATPRRKKRRRRETLAHRVRRIGIALVIFAVVLALDETGYLKTLVPTPAELYVRFALYLIPYGIAGHDVLTRAVRNIARGEVFDENFLMTIATLGSFAMICFPHTDPHMAEGAAVMLFYQVGEIFQSYAVGKSRTSIAAMMDIAPEYANLIQGADIHEVDPDEVSVGSTILIKPGERVPLDGVVIDGESQLNTAALTGESVPRVVGPGSQIISGCINMTGVLRVSTTKPYEASTVSRILELVEHASEKKAHTERFITRFARLYTPIVCCAALALAILPPLLGMGAWSTWLLRGLTFLVVSCPCALVISVPLSFFGGVGGASKLGILIKGANYLETLADVDTVVFDKTGTLTNGSFHVVAIHPEEGIDQDYLLSLAAHAEAYSEHPIALSILAAYSGVIDTERLCEVQELSGHGVMAQIDEHVVVVGNDKLMSEQGRDYHQCTLTGTVLHVSLDERYIGHMVIADVIKEHAAAALDGLREAGVARTVMLSGDRQEVAAAVATELKIDETHAQLLPADKVRIVEQLLDEQSDRAKLAFVGDGINDAPVLTRADVGIAMGAMGSDAAIEAADVVLMDDNPLNIAAAIRLARRTMRIVWENIAFALGVKLLILALAAAGMASMWLAVFGDVGVAVLAILNAMRAMRAPRTT
ncbi:heavy metal translocating P-type ATPase [Collinsella sp. zg1085]|uniref:heavy metal translocating P-type ATPase n=1 Tax=Collinsella sp. zg1085 TaxID=2844380 RepID=UPI00209B5352|nr:heavy metal translocating P-type ATPase [Collinsella sp. zg1085]